MIAALAAARHVIHVRNRNVPTELPVAWARAGQVVRAEATARSLRDEAQADALVSLVGVLSKLGENERARSLVALLPDERQPEALVAIATSRADHAPAEARQLLDRAQKAATQLQEDERETTLTAIAHGYVALGHLVSAEAVARSLEDYRRAGAAAPVAAALVRAGSADAARELACSVDEAFGQEDVIAAVVGATADIGDLDEAEAIARKGFGADFYDEGPAVTTLARVVARAGDPDRAERLARSLEESWRQNDALAAIASECALVGDVPRAQELAAALSDLEQPEVASADHNRAEISVTVVAALAREGQWDRAEAIARDAPNWVLGEMAEAVARAGNGPLAERIASRAPTEWRPRVIAHRSRGAPRGSGHRRAALVRRAAGREGRDAVARPL
jgi:hypothetical protein